MIYNYIKIAFRNILKHKSFSFINIFGLAVSISVCLLAIMLIKDAYSFDRFHPDSEKIYRVLTKANRKTGGQEPYASSPFAIGQKLSEEVSKVEVWAPMVNNFDCGVHKNGNTISGRGLFTTPSFFNMFGFELETGDYATALSDPYAIVLTKEFAGKMFKGINPLGQYLDMPAYDQAFKVTGVLKEFPGKTHLEFDALSSVATQIALEKRPSAKVVTTNLLDYYTSYNFVKLNHSNDKKVVESTLERISKENYRNLNLETRDASYEFELQALAEITPGYILSNSMGNGLPVPMLWFLTVLCLIVIFSACFNYTNLTIARSFSRFREVGVRKVMGATRSQIFAQFISEALVVALFSLGLGFLFLELLIPAFNRIQTFSQMDITLNIDEVTILLFLTFTIAVGVLAGILPALFLSRFSPLHIIQKLENVKLFRRIGLRKTFIVAQFAISLIFILVMTIAWKQVNFSFANSFGSDRTDIMNLRVPENSYSKLSTSFNNVPGVNKVSGISHLMGTWEDDKIDIKVSPGGDPIEVRDYVIDHHYIDNFNIELIAGENFVENLSQQKETFAIVNEKFLELFDLGTPIEAMGKPIFINGNEQLKVHGVVKDFLYKPMVYQLEPLLLRYNPEEWNVINLSMSSNQLPGTIAAIEKIWGEIVEGTEFQYAFYDETIEDTYTDFRDMTRVVGSFGILGIIIACLGLLGMAMYSIETRTREIGIRKIIGAGEMDLIRLLSKGFLMMIVIAIFLAVPISYIAGKFLLQFFASTIPLNFGVFFPGVFMLMLLGAIIIGSQTVRAVFANPVESIKSE